MCKIIQTNETLAELKEESYVRLSEANDALRDVRRTLETAIGACQFLALREGLKLMFACISLRKAKKATTFEDCTQALEEATIDLRDATEYRRQRVMLLSA